MGDSEPLQQFPLGPVPVSTKNAALWVFIAVFTTTATGLTSFRIATLFKGKTTFRIEDGFHLGALLAYYALVISESISLTLQGFWDSTQVPDSQASIAFKSAFLRNEFYSISNGLVKISILLFLIRLFGVSRLFKFTAGTLMVFSVAWALYDFTIILSLCHPVSAFYAVSDDYYFAHCDDVARGQHQAISGVVNFIIEFLIFLLPLPVIFQLKTSMANKLKFAVFLSFGIATITVSLVSAVYLVLQYITNANTASSNIPDGIKIVSRYRFVLETGVAMTVSAALCFRPSIHNGFKDATSFLLSWGAGKNSAGVRSNASSEKGIVLQDIHSTEQQSHIQAQQQTPQQKSTPGMYTRMLDSLSDDQVDKVG
ncbi:hypothetical protein GGR57DRAFT_505237 [Xylariaceae sp. FL1272]|nr:hypothetical protein GGR57DRAFT_505237 [Xylariaceae sp. FL1272]